MTNASVKNFLEQHDFILTFLDELEHNYVDTSVVNRKKYQYSLRRARPEKVAYFLKQVETAVLKFIIFFSLSVVMYIYCKSVNVTKPQLLLCIHTGASFIFIFFVWNLFFPALCPIRFIFCCF